MGIYFTDPPANAFQKVSRRSRFCGAQTTDAVYRGAVDYGPTGQRSHRREVLTLLKKVLRYH
jgi:hypothetical protein